MKTKKKIISENQTNIVINQYSDWFFIGLFIVTTLIYFSGQLLGTSFFWEDFVEYVYPVQTYAAKMASEGSIPFWNPYVFSGMPFMADLQVGFFYPFNRLLSFFLDSNGHLSVWGLQFIIIIHFLIAQISFFFMMKSKGVSQFGSAFSAIAYSFSMIMVCHVFHPMIVYHLAWFPLVFMLFSKAIDTGNYKFGIGAGLILGTSMLSGHPQITLYEAFFLGIFYLWIIISNLVKKQNSLILKSSIAGAATFIIALGIFQVQFLTSQELAGLSLRAELSEEKSVQGSLEFKKILNFVNPHQYGKITGDPQSASTFETILSNGKPAPYFYYWETAFYFGVLALLFGLIGLLITAKTDLTRFIIFISIFAFLYALGPNFVLHDIINSLPFFGQFRNPARMMLFVIFGISILAGIGFDSLLKNSFNDIKKSVFISLGIVSVLLLFSLIGEDIGGVAQNSAMMALVYLVVGAILIFGLTYRKINYTISGIIIICVIFTDLYLAGYDFNTSKENPELAFQMDSKMHQSFKSDSPKNLFRVNTRIYNPPFMATKRNQGMIDRFRSTEGYNPLALQRINPSLKTNDEIYDLLNVKYILQINPQTNQPYFEENFNRLPNAWLVNKTQIFNHDNIGEKMKSGQYDFTKEVLLEQNTDIKLNPDDSITSSVVCRVYKPNYLRYEILNPKDNCILVLSEIWYPAWKVFVDGIPAKLHRANYSLRAVEVPKGASKVELRFASESFAVGQWITLVTLLISIPLLVINLNGRKNAKSTSGS
jgi:hypothetical protein